MFPDDSVHPLRRWRHAQGLTLEYCARSIGTFRGVWSDWERGRRHPNSSMMPKIRKFTGGAVTADDFFPDQDEEGAKDA